MRRGGLASVAVVAAIATAAAGASARESFFGTAHSGAIARPGEVDRYRFTVRAGTRVFFDGRPARGVCGGVRTFDWSLTRAGRGAVPVFRDQPLYIAGFCSYWGPAMLDRGGEYVLTIRAPHGDTGPYAFTAWRPRVDDFRIKLVALVAPERPHRGAGRIEVPGASDRYRVRIPPRTRLYLDARALGDKFCGHGDVLRWSLYSEFSKAPIVTDALMYSLGTCHDESPIDINGGGEYAIVVHGRGDSAGPYSFIVVGLRR